MPAVPSDARHHCGLPELRWGSAGRSKAATVRTEGEEGRSVQGWVYGRENEECREGKVPKLK